LCKTRKIRLSKKKKVGLSSEPFNIAVDKKLGFIPKQFFGIKKFFKNTCTLFELLDLP